MAIQTKDPETNTVASTRTMVMVFLTATTLSSKSKPSSSRGSYSGLSRVEKTQQGTPNPTDELRKDLESRLER